MWGTVRIEQWLTFKKIFDEKHKILFQEGVININDLWFSKHNDRGKGHAMMASHREMEIKRNELKAPGGELDLDRLARHIQNLFKFKIFYNQMGFDTG